MIQTWDWLFLHLPGDKKKQKVVLENMEKQKFKQIQIKDFILKFVKEFLVTKDWNLVDESNLELCMKYQDINHRKET